jgi:hypothetical protein
MSKAAKKKPARKHTPKAADDEITAKRANACAAISGHAAGSPEALLRFGLPDMKCARSSITSELTSQHVLADLFDSDDIPAPIPDPEAAAEIIIRRLIDAGFKIKPAERCRT